MRRFGIIILLAVYINWSDGKLNPYCSVCQDHTMCQYQGIGKACEDAGEGGMSEDDKRMVVELHNWYRGNIAGGHVTRGLNGPQPKAANLMKFTYDEELASIAQRWADQCLFQHDTCRHLPTHKVGQNIYWNWRFPIINTVNWTAAIASWYDEVDKFDPSKVKSYEFDPETGHYTQMLWHNTNQVGCGRRNYGPNKIYVCNYGPAGNWLEEPMYLVGEPCSKCPSGSTCSDNLCGKTEKSGEKNGDGKNEHHVVKEENERGGGKKSKNNNEKNNKKEDSDEDIFGDLDSNKALKKNVITVPSNDVKETKPNSEEPPQPIQQLLLDFLTPPKKEAENVFDKQPFKLEPKITLSRIFQETKEIQPGENRFSLLEDGETSTVPKSTEEGTTLTTMLPADFNIIDDLRIEEFDEDIQMEIEDLKNRLNNLVQKIVERKKRKQQS